MGLACTVTSMSGCGGGRRRRKEGGPELFVVHGASTVALYYYRSNRAASGEGAEAGYFGYLSGSLGRRVRRRVRIDGRQYEYLTKIFFGTEADRASWYSSPSCPHITSPHRTHLCPVPPRFGSRESVRTLQSGPTASTVSFHAYNLQRGLMLRHGSPSTDSMRSLYSMIEYE